MSAAFHLAGFTMDVLHRQFPNSHDVWDGNWLIVKCICKTPERVVQATGPFVSVDEIEMLMHTMAKLQTGPIGRYDVRFIEPEIDLLFELGTQNDLQFVVRLTPDTPQSSYSVSFAITKNELSRAIEQCKQIIRLYPVRIHGETAPVSELPFPSNS